MARRDLNTATVITVPIPVPPAGCAGRGGPPPAVTGHAAGRHRRHHRHCGPGPAEAHRRTGGLRRRWLTAAGWADDRFRAVDAPTWARTAAAGVGTVRRPVTSRVPPRGPDTAAEAGVGLSARQGGVRGRRGDRAGPLSMVRRVPRAGDGRWLVDVRVMAG